MKFSDGQWLTREGYTVHSAAEVRDIRADERTHVRKGTRILDIMTNLDAKALEMRTRELFTECLISLGAIKKDIDMQTLTREEIEHLVGE